MKKIAGLLLAGIAIAFLISPLAAVIETGRWMFGGQAFPWAWWLVAPFAAFAWIFIVGAIKAKPDPRGARVG